MDGTVRRTTIELPGKRDLVIDASLRACRYCQTKIMRGALRPHEIRCGAASPEHRAYYLDHRKWPAKPRPGRRRKRRLPEEDRRRISRPKLPVFRG